MAGVMGFQVPKGKLADATPETRKTYYALLRLLLRQHPKLRAKLAQTMGLAGEGLEDAITELMDTGFMKILTKKDAQGQEMYALGIYDLSWRGYRVL